MQHACAYAQRCQTISVSHFLEITPNYSIALPRTCSPNAALPEPWICLLRSLHFALRAPSAGVHTSAYIYAGSRVGVLWRAMAWNGHNHVLAVPAPLATPRPPYMAASTRKIEY